MIQGLDEFVCVDITSEIYSRAKSRADNIGELRNSIRKGKGNLVGCIGEDVIKRYLDGSYARGKSKFNHDMLIEDHKIEIKSKERKHAPKLDWEASIAKSSSHQEPDFYIFTSAEKSDDKYTKLWILGYISREEFYEKARLIKAKNIDKSNWFRCKRDMYNIYHHELYPISGFLDELVSNKKS